MQVSVGSGLGRSSGMFQCHPSVISGAEFDAGRQDCSSPCLCISRIARNEGFVDTLHSAVQHINCL